MRFLTILSLKFLSLALMKDGPSLFSTTDCSGLVYFAILAFLVSLVSFEF